MPQAIGRHSLFSTCFLLLAAEVHCRHVCVCASFPSLLTHGLMTRRVFGTLFFYLGDVLRERPDEVGVKDLCVPGYITLHALVCFPSGGYKGGGESERKGWWWW